MRQKRVVRASFSMVRLRQAWAALVMESASSRMMILNGGQGFPLMERRSDNIEYKTWLQTSTSHLAYAISESGIFIPISYGWIGVWTLWRPQRSFRSEQRGYSVETGWCTHSGRDPAAVSWAKVFTFFRTTWIPRSSEALSSNTRCRYSSGLWWMTT